MLKNEIINAIQVINKIALYIASSLCILFKIFNSKLQTFTCLSSINLSICLFLISWTPWKPRFEVLDSQGQQNFIIEGECCFCLPCRDIIFKVAWFIPPHILPQVVYFICSQVQVFIICVRSLLKDYYQRTFQL